MLGRKSFRSACAFLIFTLTAATRAAAIDVSGVYVAVNHTFGPIPCSLTFVQTGTSLAIDGPCTFNSVDYTFDVAGTIDETTGEFTATGVLSGFCETPGSLTMTGTGDGETFAAVATCGRNSTSLTGTKCGNGTIDATEDCEDGNTLAGDCCSPVCLFEPNGSACAADTNSCTLDQCDGAGACQHVSVGSGGPCASDGNPCTDDVCNGADQCTHPPNTATCDDTNDCTTDDVCSARECVGGPIAAECVGDLDMTGTWEIYPAPGPFLGYRTVTITQDGAVLHSTVPASSLGGVGSVNPATGEFVSAASFTVIFQRCTQYTVGQVSEDGQTFTGFVSVDCGLEGFYGPFDVEGRRCPGGACACPADATCIPANLATQVMVGGRRSASSVRWRWRHTPLAQGFGDPTDTEYEICFETPEGSFTESAPRGQGWTATGSGYVYESRDGPIRHLTLRSDAKRTTLVAKVMIGSPPDLPMAMPLRVRLFQYTGSDTICYEGQFDSPSVNTGRRFRATE